MAAIPVMDTTAANAVLKELYTDINPLEKVVYTDRPLLAMCTKMEDMGGKLIPFPVQLNDGAGASADYTVTDGNSQEQDLIAFAVVGKTIHHKGVLSGDAIAASRSSKSAFVDLVKNEVESKLNALANECSGILFGAGTGTLAKFSAISTGVITLVNLGDVVRFYKGQKLVCTDTDGGTVFGGPTYGYVISVDRNGGKVTVSASAGGAAGTPASWSTSNPYLVLAGNAKAVATGLCGWLNTPTASESFFGVDRTLVDPQRAAGVIYDAAGKGTPEEIFLAAGARINIAGGRPDVVVMNPLDFQGLAASMGSKVTRTDLKVGLVTFKAIEVVIAGRVLPVVSDRDCPQGNVFVLDMSTVKLMSQGKIPQINDTVAPAEWYPVPGQDRMEIRFEARLMALGVSRPGHNCRIINWPAAS